MRDMMSITDMLARLRADAASEQFEGARLGPIAVRELLRHVDALAARLEAIERAEPVAWIEHELQGTGLRHLHFARRPNTLRDDVVAPVWTELIARPAPATELRRERDELAARLEAIERAEPVAWMHADRRMASGWAPRSARAENFVGWSPLIYHPSVARQPPAAEPVQAEPVGGCSDSVSCPRGAR